MDDDIFLFEQNNEPAKLSFEKEVNSIEFTEAILGMDLDINNDQRKVEVLSREEIEKVIAEINGDEKSVSALTSPDKDK